jgi:hypothetical protein
MNNKQPKQVEQIQEESESVKEPVEETEVDNVETETTEVLEPESKEQELTDDERLAYEAGWRPKEQFKGDLKNYRSAKEFLLYTTISDNKKELKRMEASLRVSSELNRRLFEKTQKERIEWGKNQKKAAIELGNVDEVEKYEKFIKDEQDELQKYVPEKKHDEIIEQQNKTIHPAVTEYIKRNPWTGDNSETGRRMQRYSIAFDNELGKAHPDMSVEDRLEAMDKEIKAMFPSQFENKNRTRAPSVNMASPENVSIKKSTKRKYTFNELPHSIRANVRDMARLSGMPLDDYAQQLYDTGYIQHD